MDDLGGLYFRIGTSARNAAPSILLGRPAITGEWEEDGKTRWYRREGGCVGVGLSV